MSTWRMNTLFAPRSVAVVGASPDPTSRGAAILRNLAAGGFKGDVTVVNPHHREVEGHVTRAALTDLPATPDVVVVTAPAEDVPAIVEQAGAMGACAAIIVTGGLEQEAAAGMAAAARRTGLRLVGPGSFGVVSPQVGFQAGFSARLARRGDLAVISQSGAVATAILERAESTGTGVSGLITLGDKVDVDFGDCLDYFAEDRGTRAILLYLEQLNNPRKFMSAARAAARTKPVVVLKAGRHASGTGRFASHTAALAGSDAVFEAAFRRAGLLRVPDLDALFSAVETLARVGPFSGENVSVLTNGGGLGLLALDRLGDFEAQVAALAPDTQKALRALTPADWSGGNPVDLGCEADAGAYGGSLRQLLDDAGTDAVLVMNCPTALADAAEAAEAVAQIVTEHRRSSLRPKPVFAVWLGGPQAATEAFEKARVPSYATESDAVEGIMYLVAYRKAQTLLMETPPSLPAGFSPDVDGARAAVRKALVAGRRWLDPVAVSTVLAAYGIPLAASRTAETPEEAARAAAPFIAAGQAVAVKILSDDIPHKSEVGGVVLNLTTAESVADAMSGMLSRVARERPNARIEGVTVHPVINSPHGRELIAGLADDPTFGPVVVFGRGGRAVEVINDKALALPPLDMALARTMMMRTRVWRVLQAYRGIAAANVEAVALVLVKLAQLSADVPEIRELDLNPLLADEHGVIALDARIAVEPLPTCRRRETGNPRFAIKPYPKEWERDLVLKGGWRVQVRPVRPEDEPLYPPFFARVTAEDLRLRFFAHMKEFSHAFIARLTQLDYSRAIAFAAIEPETGDLLGVVRLHSDANHEVGEYAILLRSDLKGRGLGWALMKLMIEYAVADGLATVKGQVLRENTTMLSMVEALGFGVKSDPDDMDVKVVTLDLAQAGRIKEHEFRVEKSAGSA
jgi:acetyltransferase